MHIYICMFSADFIEGCQTQKPKHHNLCPVSKSLLQQDEFECSQVIPKSSIMNKQVFASHSTLPSTCSQIHRVMITMTTGPRLKCKQGVSRVGPDLSTYNIICINLQLWKLLP